MTLIAHKKAYIAPVDVTTSIRNLVANSFQRYQQLDVPRIYHGIIKRSCLDEVKQKAGSYFQGLSPDIFMSVALCFTTHNVVKVNYPITISGICPRSGSADSATGRHTGELKDAPHFRGHQGYEWSEEVPYLYTVETIWADSGMQALKIFAPQMVGDFSLRDMAARIALKYPQFKSRSLQFLEEKGISCRGIGCLMIKLRVAQFIRRTYHSIRLRCGSSRIFKLVNIPDIEVAADTTTSALFKV